MSSSSSPSTLYRTSDRHFAYMNIYRYTWQGVVLHTAVVADGTHRHDSNLCLPFDYRVIILNNAYSRCVCVEERPHSLCVSAIQRKCVVPFGLRFSPCCIHNFMLILLKCSIAAQRCGILSLSLSLTHSICPSLFCIDDKIVLMICVCPVHVCVRDRFAPILNTNMHFR